MVKIIGIIAILYVCYCEIDAETKPMLNVSSTATYEDIRRGIQKNKRISTPVTELYAAEYRKTKYAKHTKFTNGTPAEKKTSHHKPIDLVLNHHNSNLEHNIINRLAHRSRDDNKYENENIEVDINENEKTIGSKQQQILYKNKHLNTEERQKTQVNQNTDDNNEMVENQDGKYVDTQDRDESDDMVDDLALQDIKENHDVEEVEYIEATTKKNREITATNLIIVDNNEVSKNVVTKPKLDLVEDHTNVDYFRHTTNKVLNIQSIEDENNNYLKKLNRNKTKTVVRSKGVDEALEYIRIYKRQQDRDKIRNAIKEKIMHRYKEFEEPKVPKTVISSSQPFQEDEPTIRHANKRSKKHRHSKLRTTNDKDNSNLIRSTKMMGRQDPQEKDDSTKRPEGPAPKLFSPYSVMAQMKEIMEGFTDVNATFETLGRTAEYNDIILVKISQCEKEAEKYFRTRESKFVDEVPEKKIIFIVHGLTVMGIKYLKCLMSIGSFKKLLSFYFKHLDKFDIYLIPMANPDGVVADMIMASTGGLWNKNKSPQDSCLGVCLDRNFDVAWNSTKQISSCSQLYPGPLPFSEPETRAIREVFHQYSHKIIAYIHVHPGTYSNQVFKGDAVLYPRGYTETQSDDDKYIDLKGDIDEAMKNASFSTISVTVDTVHNWYGKVSGTSVDYASTVFGIPYALEFVMQTYADEDTIDVETHALNAIWCRVIDTTFNNLWKTLRANDVKRK